MDFLEATPVTFKEITPNPSIPEKWKEVILNTGGTHSTLQDIKLPQKGGGYWYNDSKKSYSRNRFIYWRTTSDAIELSEASLDINLTGANLRCKVAPGTPPLSTITVYEHAEANKVVILAATVSSVHRFIFPHPIVLDKKSTFGSLSNSSPSIFHDTNSLNIPNNYHILNQYSNSTLGVAHTCTSLLRENGEAVFALAFGQGGEGALLVVKLPLAGSTVTTLLKRESTMPRFLSGITGALRGKNSGDGVETYGVILTNGLAIAVCGDTCLRAWSLDEGGAPIAVTPPLSQALVRPKPPPHGHMLQKTLGSDGSVILVAYLSFPNECEFVVMKMLEGGTGGVRFLRISRIFGPQLDLLDYTIGCGDSSNVIWALWSRPDGDTIITSSTAGAEAGWRASRGPDAPAPLPAMASHAQYRDRLLQPGLFPHAVLRKALLIYNRTWGGGDASIEGELGDCAMAAVQSRLRHLSARSANADHAHLMHKCWTDLYSWCMQYMEGLQKPLGLMVSKVGCESEVGWWCAVVRRAGISLVCELEPLERIMLSPNESHFETGGEGGEGAGGGRVVALGAAWEQRVGVAGARELERRVFASPAPHHRLLPRLLHLLAANTDKSDDALPTLTPQQIEELTQILEPIKDLQSAVLELNDALRLDVSEIDTTNSIEGDTGEYDSLFASDLGVAVVTEAIRQMAEMRCRVVRGAAGALGVCVGGAGGGVPGGGHCGVHWQAYRALLWLRTAPLQHVSSGSSEAFRLKLSVLGAEPSEIGAGVAGAGGVVGAYAAGAGGRRARVHLRAARANTHWPHAMPLFTYHLAHQLWAVSGGFEFGWWLATINQPRLVQSYVNMLEPWCEWNSCSRQFILGLALLDLDDQSGAYAAFCKAAKGVATEPFLRQRVAAPEARLTHHQALVLYYMKVIKLFEIHDAGAWVVRLAETAISIADKDDPNLAMFQWLVFKWHLSGGRTDRALAAAAANPAPNARAAAAAALLTTLGARRELGALVSCGALAPDAERAAAARAKLHDAHTHNPYYDFLYALHVSRHHYRKAAAVLYERAARCAVEPAGGAVGARRRWLAAALACLRLAQPEHAFLARPKHATNDKRLQVIGPEELAAELREEEPESLDVIKRALQNGENINFDNLYPKLKDADPEMLLAVTKRALSAGQFMPRWFLTRYMEVDGAGCVRALLLGGRVAEAGALCTEAVRGALARLGATPRAPLAAPPGPLAAPLALADLLLCEMRSHLQTPYINQIHNELESSIKEYTQLVIRTTKDMKLAYLEQISIH